jgi:hypothetical protein
MNRFMVTFRPVRNRMNCKQEITKRGAESDETAEIGSEAFPNPDLSPLGQQRTTAGSAL